MNPSYQDLISTCIALLGAGMTPSQVGLAMGASTRDYRWPSARLNWGYCLEDLLISIGKWQVLWPVLFPLVRSGAGLSWKQVFATVGACLKTAEDRFEFLYQVLLHYSNNPQPAFLNACLTHLADAGISPISMQVCCAPTLYGSLLMKMIRKQFAGVNAKPLSSTDQFAPYDILEWALDCPPDMALDGLISNSPTRIHAGFRSGVASSTKVHIGNHMLLGDSLGVHGDGHIQTLGYDIHVFGNLEVIGLRNLTFLGNRIRIEGNLSIIGSPRLHSLPPDLWVGGRVRIINPPYGFTYAPDFPMAKRTSRLEMEDRIEIECPESLTTLRGY